MASFSNGLVHQKFKILVHGGAWDIPEHLTEAHRQGTKKAWTLAHDLLCSGEDGLSVVTKVLGYLEDDPTFDAGIGSFLNEDGDVELDASIMRGSDLAAGCIGAIRNFSHPSAIALELLNDGSTVFLAGDGAEIFAEKKGFVKVPPQDLVHPREIASHKSWIRAGRPDPKTFFSSPNTELGEFPDRRGTVGCVIGIPKGDGNYRLFAGTSTGGVPGKKRGRIGDVPIIGAGIIADDEGVALSATGWGEGLLRMGAAMAVNERFKSGTPLLKAISDVLKEMHRRVEGRGGLIAIDRFGSQVAAFTTPDMAFAGEQVHKIYIP